MAKCSVQCKYSGKTVQVVLTNGEPYQNSITYYCVWMLEDGSSHSLSSTAAVPAKSTMTVATDTTKSPVKAKVTEKCAC